jgi:hypothetical protein
MNWRGLKVDLVMKLPEPSRLTALVTQSGIQARTRNPETYFWKVFADSLPNGSMSLSMKTLGFTALWFWGCVHTLYLLKSMLTVALPKALLLTLIRCQGISLGSEEILLIIVCVDGGTFSEPLALVLASLGFGR